MHQQVSKFPQRLKSQLIHVLRGSSGSHADTAETDFVELVGDGCPERPLIGYLFYLQRVYGPNGLRTRSLIPRKRKQIIRRLSKTREDLEKLHALHILEIVTAIFAWMPDATLLIEACDGVANGLKTLVKFRGATEQDSAIARFLAFIGEYGCKDAQAAALIAAVINKPEFDAQSVAIWRNRHKKLLSEARRQKPTFQS